MQKSDKIFHASFLVYEKGLVWETSNRFILKTESCLFQVEIFNVISFLCYKCDIENR